MSGADVINIIDRHRESEKQAAFWKNGRNQFKSERVNGQSRGVLFLQCQMKSVLDNLRTKFHQVGKSSEHRTLTEHNGTF
jgi:hypothetical protein